MASPTIIHVIGTATLIAVLIIISSYIFTSTQITIRDNERKNLEKIVDSLRLQLIYLLKINTNISLRLMYPLYAIYDHEYNIYVGSGYALMNTLSILGEELDPNGIYVVAVDPSNNVYSYAYLVENATTKPIILSRNPVVFGSSLIVYAVKTLTPNNIYLDFRIEGSVVS
jgi:hypothetical protein